MAVTEKVLWQIYAGALGAVSTIAARKLITKAWEVATGDEPPDPNDPETPLVQAIIWALASGVGVGMTQLAMNRYMQRHWRLNMGQKAPGKRRNKLDLEKT